MTLTPQPHHQQVRVSVRAAADQLGHAKVSKTQDNHFGRKVAKTGATEVLEAIIAASKKPRNTGVKEGRDHDVSSR